MAVQVTETEQMLASEVTEILDQERGLAQMELELAQDPKFQAFLQRQKEVRSQIDEFWKRVEGEMIKHDIKSIKGDWGTLTIAEKLGWDVVYDMLPAKFFKKVPDTKRMSDTYRLEGKAPRGATPTITKYLTKRFK